MIRFGVGVMVVRGALLRDDDCSMKKLNNQNFVSRAKPEIVASEQKKKADAEEKIRLLKKQLASLN